MDADFSGNWDKGFSLTDLDTARSRTSFIATFAGCPIFWTSKLQTTIALSTMEAEYVILSTALHDIIPMIGVMKEMKEHGISIDTGQPNVHCNIFEDNNGAIQIATKHQWHPCTKHINIQYHHFHSFVTDGSIKIFPIDSVNQPTDMLTKPLASELLYKH